MADLNRQELSWFDSHDGNALLWRRNYVGGVAAIRKRHTITVAATAIGFSLGIATSDIDTIRGMLRTATAGAVAGLIGLALAALLERRQ